MVVPKTSAVRPQGSVIEGKDKTGRRYKYVVGHRGRVSLGDAKPSAGGKAPTKDFLNKPNLSKRSTGSLVKASAKQLPQSSVHARAMAQKIIANHAEWEKSGDLHTAGRLSELFDKGRDRLLKQGNKSEAHRAFAGVVLATIFQSNYHGKKSGGKYNIVFNAGGAGKPGYIKFKTKDGKDVGGITFNDITKIGDQDIAKAKEMYHSLAEKAKGEGKAKGHKSAAKEHTAMVQALSVKPPAAANPKAPAKTVPTNGSSKPAKQTAPTPVEKKEVLPGGKGDKKPDSAFKKESLKQGMKVESEHTKNKAVQKEIAKDHLTEDPKYYDKLKKVEAEKPATKMTWKEYSSASISGAHGNKDKKAAATKALSTAREELQKQGLSVHSTGSGRNRVYHVFKDYQRGGDSSPHKDSKGYRSPEEAALEFYSKAPTTTASFSRVSPKTEEKKKPARYNKGNRHKYKAGPKSANKQILDAKKRKSEAEIKREQKKRLKKG